MRATTDERRATIVQLTEAGEQEFCKSTAARREGRESHRGNVGAVASDREDASSPRVPQDRNQQPKRIW